jgi:hypothetical protein
MDLLCTDHPDEQAAQQWAVEVKQEWDIIPNYEVRGDSGFRDPTGVYWVGKPPSERPFRPLPPNVTSTLGYLISAVGKGGAVANRVYWLACRSARVDGLLTQDFARAWYQEYQGDLANITNASGQKFARGFGQAPLDDCQKKTRASVIAQLKRREALLIAQSKQQGNVAVQ